MKFFFYMIISISLLFSSDIINSIGMKFKEVPSGDFLMGAQADCPKDNPFTENDELEECIKQKNIKKEELPAHIVKIQRFYMQETEVTQGQWYDIMGNNPARFKVNDKNMPIERVSFDDVLQFIVRLNIKESTKKYSLPTEEEWEYAARAGISSKWYSSNQAYLTTAAVYATNNPLPVKSKQPNDWGLYDMLGNVWEWTKSGWRNNYNDDKHSQIFTSRGGSWYDSTPDDITLSRRRGMSSVYSNDNLGFRLIINP